MASIPSGKLFAKGVKFLLPVDNFFYFYLLKK